MLETIRAYAREQLASSNEGEAAHRAQAAYFVELAERAAREMAGPDQARALALLDAEIDNVRAALDWAQLEEPARALRIAASLGRYWGVKGLFREARERLDAAAESAELDAAAGARALLAGGNIARLQGDRAGARSFFERGLAHARLSGPVEYVARFLSALGGLERLEDRPARARELFEEALGALAAGDLASEAVIRFNLAVVRFDDHDDVAAAELLDSSCALFEDVGDKQQLANASATLAFVQHERGDELAATVAMRQALDLLVEVEEPAVTGFALMIAAIVLGDPLAAARWLGLAEGVWARLGRNWESLEQRAHEAAERVAQTLAPNELDAARREGAELSLRAALDEAMSLISADVAD
jgi:tetratricopeptide (TPR) repeat protein